MSREERKMAQIIASIERMEQEKRRPATPHEAEAQVDVQGGAGSGASDAARTSRTKKSKKGKKGVAKKLKVVTAASAGPGPLPFDRKLTPKKRWIQLWSAQLDALDTTEADEEVPEAAKAPETENREVGKAPSVPLASAAASATAQPVQSKEVAEKAVEKAVPPPQTAQNAARTQKVVEKPAVVAVAKPVVEKPGPVAETGLQPSQKPPASATKADTTSSAATATSGDLRVKTPQNTESSHLSPPLERNSPTGASISPSAKTKESEATPSATKTTEARHPPTTAEPEAPTAVGPEQSKQKTNPTLEKKESSSSVTTSASSSNSAGQAEDEKRRDPTGRSRERGRKRGLEPSSDMPLSEEAKRRAERRRKRKSNWDVGDPRHGGSPATATDLTPSAAAATANQLSFAKFPPSGRPSWRHSQSMMDMRPSHFQGRSSFHNNPSSGRRSFHHSNSMPLDRSRSAGRSSRYGSGSR